MPKKSGEKSGRDSARQERKYLYDLIYNDSLRIGSFQAQLGSYGALKGIQKSSSTSSGTSSSSDITGKIGVPLALHAESKIADSNTKGFEEGITYDYDPLGIDALDFVEKLNETNLLQRDIKTANIGHFILVSGDIRVQDGLLTQKVLENPLLSGRAIAMAPPESQDAGLSEQEVLRLTPKAIQGTVDTGTDVIWMSLQPRYMSISANDFSLMHGPLIVGRWSVLGILEAVPDVGEPFVMPVVPPNDNAAMAAAIATLKTNFIGVVSMNLSFNARTSGGRPSYSYGITPLLIYREISN